MATENTFTMIAEHHESLEEHGEIHEVAGCYVPKVDKHTLSLLESHAEIAIADNRAEFVRLAIQEKLERDLAAKKPGKV